MGNKLSSKKTNISYPTCRMEQYSSIVPKVMGFQTPKKLKAYLAKKGITDKVKRARFLSEPQFAKALDQCVSTEQLEHYKIALIYKISRFRNMVGQTIQRIESQIDFKKIKNILNGPINPQAVNWAMENFSQKKLTELQRHIRVQHLRQVYANLGVIMDFTQEYGHEVGAMKLCHATLLFSQAVRLREMTGSKATQLNDINKYQDTANIYFRLLNVIRNRPKTQRDAAIKRLNLPKNISNIVDARLVCLEINRRKKYGANLDAKLAKAANSLFSIFSKKETKRVKSLFERGDDMAFAEQAHLEARNIKQGIETILNSSRKKEAYFKAFEERLKVYQLFTPKNFEKTVNGMRKLVNTELIKLISDGSPRTFIERINSWVKSGVRRAGKAAGGGIIDGLLGGDKKGIKRSIGKQAKKFIDFYFDPVQHRNIFKRTNKSFKKVMKDPKERAKFVKSLKSYLEGLVVLQMQPLKLNARQARLIKIQQKNIAELRKIKGSIKDEKLRAKTLRNTMKFFNVVQLPFIKNFTRAHRNIGSNKYALLAGKYDKRQKYMGILDLRSTAKIAYAMGLKGYQPTRLWNLIKGPGMHIAKDGRITMNLQSADMMPTALPILEKIKRNPYKYALMRYVGIGVEKFSITGAKVLLAEIALRNFPGLRLATNLGKPITARIAVPILKKILSKTERKLRILQKTAKPAGRLARWRLRRKIKRTTKNINRINEAIKRWGKFRMARLPRFSMGLGRIGLKAAPIIGITLGLLSMGEGKAREAFEGTVSASKRRVAEIINKLGNGKKLKHSELIKAIAKAPKKIRDQLRRGFLLKTIMDIQSKDGIGGFPTKATSKYLGKNLAIQLQMLTVQQGAFRSSYYRGALYDSLILTNAKLIDLGLSTFDISLVPKSFRPNLNPNTHEYLLQGKQLKSLQNYRTQLKLAIQALSKNKKIDWKIISKKLNKDQVVMLKTTIETLKNLSGREKLQRAKINKITKKVVNEIKSKGRIYGPFAKIRSWFGEDLKRNLSVEHNEKKKEISISSYGQTTKIPYYFIPRIEGTIIKRGSSLLITRYKIAPGWEINSVEGLIKKINAIHLMKRVAKKLDITSKAPFQMNGYSLEVKLKEKMSKPWRYLHRGVPGTDSLSSQELVSSHGMVARIGFKPEEFQHLIKLLNSWHERKVFGKRLKIYTKQKARIGKLIDKKKHTYKDIEGLLRIAKDIGKIKSTLKWLKEKGFGGNKNIDLGIRATGKINKELRKARQIKENTKTHEFSAYGLKVKLKKTFLSKWKIPGLNIEFKTKAQAKKIWINVAFQIWNARKTKIEKKKEPFKLNDKWELEINRAASFSFSLGRLVGYNNVTLSDNSFNKIGLKGKNKRIDFSTFLNKLYKKSKS